MSLLLLHPGDLGFSQWVMLFIVWIVAPIVILYIVVKYINRWRNGPK